MDQEAFVTCATNDTYALGALVLAHSLRNVQTSRKLAIIITPHVSEKIRTLLGNVFDVVKQVNLLDSQDEANLAILTRPDLGVTFTKFQCWRLTQFQKCVFLDADTLVIKNCDELFEKDEFSAVPDVGWPDCFNSGVFVYRPSEETYKAIINFAVQHGSFDGGDQGVLNMFFKEWRTSDISKHLSFIYNMNANATYSYQPAYRQFGKDVKIVHFLGAVKPWMQFFNSETGRVQPDSPHSYEHLQMWWDTFMRHVQPNLTDECKGLAGELSKLQLGPAAVSFAASSEARRFAWERGQIDYMGADAFSNIEKRLAESINGKKIMSHTWDQAAEIVDEMIDRSPTCLQKKFSSMQGVTEFEQKEYTLRQRKMVPRVAPEMDHEMPPDGITHDHKDVCENADYNKNDTSNIIGSMISKPYDKEPKGVSWNFESEQLINDTESRRSLMEEEVIIPETKETMLSVALQVFVPFLIAGFGTVGAGLVLDIVQHWEVFRIVSEIFILVPALLGLKGNLEMTLASRLSTQANLGHMDTAKEQWKLASGNMALIQCQATVVGFLASLFAMIMGWIPEGKFNMGHAFLLCASSLVTASVASFVLGCVMVGVVIFSRKCSINPDNVATPIAASLGDLTTLCLLAGISNLLYEKLDSPGFAITIIVFFLLLIPLWITIAKRNRYTREVLYSGWTPVISAMAISSVGGCILDFAVDRFHGIAVFQPVINGVGGNLVAVQASRISTYLHQRSKLGVLPAEDSDLCKDPITAFFGKSVHAMTARVLMSLVIPGHLVFTYGIRFVNAGHTSVTPMFLSFYLLAAVLQVALLLYCAHVMIHWMWVKQIDPDNSAIPYLTALGDFLGTALLAIAFSVLYTMGDKDADVGE